MAGHCPYSGRRKVVDHGTSVTVTIPKQGLDELGIERDDIIGSSLPATVENGEFRVDLEEAIPAGD